MKRSLGNLLLCLSFLGALVSGPVASAAISKFEQIEPPAPLARDWNGGPVSLPIGREHLASEILNAAHGLPETQDLESLFYSRGYIRRSDLDAAGGSDSLSYALIGWEKPGTSVLSEAPVIQIISKNYLDPDLGRRVIATQSFGAVVRDSAGIPMASESVSDAPVAVVELVPVGTSGAITADPGKLFSSQGAMAYRFAYHEGTGGFGKMVQDGWKVSCPFRKGLTKVGIGFAGGAAGATSLVSGNWWAAGLLGAATVAAEMWVDAKMICQ